MNSSQSSKIIRKLERERFLESVSCVEKKLEEIKMMYRNYKENSETLEDDATSALDDTTWWVERAKRLHIEASEAKQRELGLRNRIKKLEREASQTGRQPKEDGGKLSKTRQQYKDTNRTPAAPGNPSTTERILAACVTCVGSVLVYGFYKLTAPFLI